MNSELGTVKAQYVTPVKITPELLTEKIFVSTVQFQSACQIIEFE